jgi:hypothetical protein
MMAGYLGRRLAALSAESMALMSAAMKVSQRAELWAGKSAVWTASRKVVLSAAKWAAHLVASMVVSLVGRKGPLLVD